MNGRTVQGPDVAGNVAAVGLSRAGPICGAARENHQIARSPGDVGRVRPRCGVEPPEEVAAGAHLGDTGAGQPVRDDRSGVGGIQKGDPVDVEIGVGQKRGTDDESAHAVANEIDGTRGFGEPCREFGTFGFETRLTTGVVSMNFNLREACGQKATAEDLQACRASPKAVKQVGGRGHRRNVMRAVARPA